MARRLNLVVFVWHDLGDWLGCYGKPWIASPRLDQFAAEGALFGNHCCNAPQCSPSRATLMTGRYPQAHGVLGLTHRGWRYRPGETDLPMLLGAAGYRTYLAGFQHERPPGELTYQEVITAERHSDKVAPPAAAFLRERARASQPFFLCVGFGDVHRPFGSAYDPARPARIAVPGFLPDAPVVRKDLATFAQRIEQADAAVGQVLDAIHDGGLDGDTLVVFTTDHGPEFPRAKMTLYDPGLRVALLARLPGVIPPGQSVSALTSHVDVAPTLLELLDVPVPATMQGHSLRGYLDGQPPADRDAIFAQMTWHGGEYDPMRGVRTRRWKYIRNFVPGWPPQMAGTYTQRYGEEFITRHYGKGRPAEELYDLHDDPWEQHNLAGDPAFQETLWELSARVVGWMREIDDPLLRGPIACTDRARAGYKCVWGIFPTRDPDQQHYRFEIIRTADFHEPPLP